MDLGLKDKNALVTGGSRGLGLASAISLAKEGVNIIICARSEEDLSKAKSKIQVSSQVGKVLAQRAMKNKIDKVVFDRNGYPYHGRVKAIAEAAREGGLKF